MQDLTSLHHEAMEWMDRAVLARRQGDRDSMLQCTKTAFSKERSAADLVAPQFDLEPTRSVLHRSAAVLAIECGLLREAEQLIGRALSGNPPNDIANELRDLLMDEVYSQRHSIES